MHANATHRHNGAGAVAVQLLPEDRVITVAPDSILAGISPAAQPPARFGFVEWQHIGGNDYRAIIRHKEKWVPLRKLKGGLTAFGIDYYALRRLVAAGFIVGTQFTPGKTSICLQSFAEHVEACRKEGTAFWTAERRRRYTEAVAEVTHSDGQRDPKRVKNARGRNGASPTPSRAEKRAAGIGEARREA